MARGETVIVASSFEQARIAFEHVIAFMGEKFRDRSRWKVWDTAQQARIEDRHSGCRVRCIGSDPRRAHGLAPVLVLADEPAQWPENTGERMVAALRTAAGKQPHSRFVSLGTRPADAGHWFSKALAGGADYAQCHAARPEDPRFQVRAWRKANPSWSAMPDLQAAIRKEAEEARRGPALLAAFEALRLNLGTADTEVAVLLDPGLWAECEGEAALSGPLVYGIDLGTSAAQSAVAAFAPETGALQCLAAFPEAPSLADRGLRDGVAGSSRNAPIGGNCSPWGIARSTSMPYSGRRSIASAPRPASWPTDGARRSYGTRSTRPEFRPRHSRRAAWVSRMAPRTCERSAGPVPMGR